MKKLFNIILKWHLTLLLAFSIPNIQASSYASGLIAYWKFDEGTGATVSDSIYNYQGNIINGANWTTGVTGGALSFDGFDDYVLINNFPHIFPTFIQNLSVELWLKVKGDSSVRTYNGFVGDGWGNWGNVNFNFAYDNALKRWDLWDSSLGQCPGLNDMGYVYQDIGSNWTHVVITYGQGACNSGTCKSLYVNGELKQSNPVCPNAVNYVNSQNLYIGASPGDEQYINADIDELAIYSRALTLQEIQQHYQNALKGLSLGDGTSCKYAGKFEGTYSGVDRGTWRATINDNCVLRGKAISVDGSVFNGSGEVTTDGEFTMVVGSTNVGEFSGQMYRNGSISGNWSNRWNEHGKFKGKSISIPKITKFSQNKGKPGDVIIMTGNNFWYAEGKVLFGTKKAHINGWNNHSIIFTVPQLNVGSKGMILDIKVKSTNGRTSAGKKFKIIKRN